MRTLLWGALTAAVAIVSVGVCRRYEHRHTLKRVAVSYAEKYEDKTIGRSQEYEKVESDRALYAEEQLSFKVARDKTCMVLSHDAKHADYDVDISVIRFVGDPSTYGEATLTITRPNGDVVATEHFYQDKTSHEDISQQPITKVWEVLCKAE
jgi:hypothetical protein